MTRKTFDSFSEASTFARKVSKPGANATVRRTVHGFEVEFESPGPTDDGSSKSEIQQLSRALEDFRARIRSLQNQVTSLNQAVEYKDQIIFDLENDIENRVSDKTAHEHQVIQQNERARQEKYDALVSEFEQERDNVLAQLKQQQEELREKEIEWRGKRNEYQRRIEELDALKNAYADRFGKAEVEEFQRETITKGICHNCQGDGGATGQCRFCDGTGWEERTIYQTERLVRFDEDAR